LRRPECAEKNPATRTDKCVFSFIFYIKVVLLIKNNLGVSFFAGQSVVNDVS